MMKKTKIIAAHDHDKTTVTNGVLGGVIKPPLGLTPKYIRNEQRMKEIRDAVVRYEEADKKIPIEWIEEYENLLIGV